MRTLREARMQTTPTTDQLSELTIFGRLLENGRETLTPDLARYVLGLDFSDEDRARMRELAKKAQAGKLTAAEMRQVDSYGKAGSLLGILQSRARRALKSGRSRTTR